MRRSEHPTGCERTNHPDPSFSTLRTYRCWPGKQCSERGRQPKSKRRHYPKIDPRAQRSTMSPSTSATSPGMRNPENRREILADDTLEAVFGKKKVTMFEMNKYLAQHLTPPEAG